VHLRELELSLRADSLWKGGISDNVSQCLAVRALSLARGLHEEVGSIPFRLVLGEHLALGVVADVANVYIASNVELGRAELRHDGGGYGRNGVSTKCR
jgi:hypothetical protein